MVFEKAVLNWRNNKNRNFGFLWNVSLVRFLIVFFFFFLQIEQKPITQNKWHFIYKLKTSSKSLFLVLVLRQLLRRSMTSIRRSKLFWKKLSVQVQNWLYPCFECPQLNCCNISCRVQSQTIKWYSLFAAAAAVSAFTSKYSFKDIVKQRGKMKAIKE